MGEWGLIWEGVSAVATILGSIGALFAAYFTFSAASAAAKSARTTANLAQSELYLELLKDNTDFWAEVGSDVQPQNLTVNQKRRRNRTIAGRIQMEDLRVDANDPRVKSSGAELFTRSVDRALVAHASREFMDSARNESVRRMIQEVADKYSPKTGHLLTDNPEKPD